jgi:hypothetical protein
MGWSGRANWPVCAITDTATPHQTQSDSYSYCGGHGVCSPLRGSQNGFEANPLNAIHQLIEYRPQFSITMFGVAICQIGNSRPECQAI